MGSTAHYPEESPVVLRDVEPFRVHTTPVTNADYAEFVDKTGYVTVAERPLDPSLYPGASAKDLVPGSLVFIPTDGPVDLANPGFGGDSFLVHAGDFHWGQVVTLQQKVIILWCT